MRVLKFRAWDTTNKEMILPCGNMVIDSYSGFPMWSFAFDPLVPQPDWVLMQYTGLKDKNGKEIYESDLLAFEAWEWYRPEIVDKDYIFQVEQSETGEWVGAGICTEWATYCEVVGNIYQSPELLEAT